MADDRTKRGPQDAARVNINEDYELRYWTEQCSVSRAELEEFVRWAGPGAAAVAQALGK
ncbi:MAG: DUF3606 domain-containing protein [Alphaproteobacteria bacterium]|nr:MAG: DUF3606 domain-containing protein [Alphaproteobacteria bacterium]